MDSSADLCVWLRRLAFAVTAAFLCAQSVAVAQDARRVALVIGNGAYQNVTPLANPRNDAEALAEVLRSLGFDVDLEVDVDKARMRLLADELHRRVDGVELALFFYAGHGFQIDGRNYVLPVDARIRTEQDVSTEAMDVDTFVIEMNRGADIKVVLLDACRNNPFEEELSRSMGPARASSVLGRGLTPIQPAGGVLVGFATDPGAVAYDGTGHNSPFTTALLAHLPSPNVEINTVMIRVRADVFESTGQLQRPWTTTSLVRELYLDAQPQDETDQEMTEWQVAEKSSTYQALTDFAALHPDGNLHDKAAAQLAAATADRTNLVDDYVSTPQAEMAPLPKGFRDCPDCPLMQTLPIGAFTMGSAFGPGSEKPQTHRVIAHGFALGRTEVTRREWQVCAGAGACRTLPGAVDEAPAAGMSWDEVQDYLVWLGGRTGRQYRLPSETEWEYAAQGGAELRYPTGPVLLPKAAYFNRPDGAPVQVASYQPNPFGLHDLAGNLWEWVADCGARYDASMTGATAVTARPCIRVLRGGGFRSSADQLRAANRFFVQQASSRDDFGFRVALDLE